MAPNIGQLQQVIALQAAPDLANIHRVSVIMGWAAGALDGSDDPGQVVGYDRGDATHSFNGPVRLVPNPTKAVNATASPGGIYKPTAEFQNGLSQNIALDPYNRALFARMAANG